MHTFPHASRVTINIIIKATTAHLRHVNFKISWILIQLAKAVTNFHDWVVRSLKRQIISIRPFNSSIKKHGIAVMPDPAKFQVVFFASFPVLKFWIISMQRK